MELNLKQSQAVNAISWILSNRIINENDSPIEFHDHAFLVDPYLDRSPRQVIMKCAQIGWSTLAILRSFHLAKYAQANIIHTFPSRNMSKDFVVPKVNPLIMKNKVMSDMITEDTVTLKGVAGRYIYYRGSYEQTEAISISAHILINDEFDRCLLPDTEILTKDGWKKIQDITLEDKVAVRHPIHHNVSFKNPNEIVSIDYDGEIYRFKGRSLNLAVTKNHKMWAKIRGGLKYHLHKAKDLLGKKFVMSGQAKWLYDGNDRIKIPCIWTKRGERFTGKVKTLSFPAKEVPIKAWYQFLGWYLSEGCIAKSKNSRGIKRANGSIVISQKNREYVDEIVEIIKKLGFKPRLYRQKSGVTSVHFTSLHLSLYLQKLGDVYNKYIPSRWLWGNPKYLPYLLETLIKGDGDERNVYTTVSKQLADDIQILALRIGKSASIYWNGRCYKVGILERPYRRFNGYRESQGKATVTRENYKGKVYCLEVPYHIFMVRSPLPIWTGNSNQKVLKTYRSRLDDVARERPELGWEWQFSNPSIPGAGVDVWWKLSDQKHWFVKCSHCKHEWYLKFPDNIDFEKKLRVCATCGKELTRDDLRNGRWVQKYKNRKISGYWISQMMVPWISAEKIIEDSEGDQDIFHNFTLGLPFISKDTSVSREAILKCLSPGYNPQTNVAIGVDNGVKKHYVVGNKYGIFKVGVTEDWKEIEDMRNRYGAIMVIDALPYPNTPRKLADQYAGKVYLHYYQPDRKRIGIIRWDEQVVRSDRTKIIDSVVGDFNAGDITINMTERQLEDYIRDWGNLYRIIKLTPQGIKKPSWETIEGKPDHFAHATILWKVALDQTLGLGTIVSPEGPSKKKGHPAINPDETVPALDLEEVAKKLSKKKRSWKTI